ncbi:MAG: YdcF family protein [Clostridia bacterium]|jgi:SanA protein|nr:YdcF family protein [Clostridia bacterium]
MNKYLKLGAIGIVITVIIISIINVYTGVSTDKYLYSDIEKIPSNDVGMVLGTSKYTIGGLNLYFKKRMDAAEMLYKRGKIRYIIVSGDNAHMSYNEPITMQKELMERGIPEDKIYLDYAGFRTLDSVVRAKEIFGQSKITIISQKFHNERAVYIARRRGIEAIGYNAGKIIGINSVKTNVREYFAKVAMFLDIYLLNKQPKFLGEKIVIGNETKIKN